MPKIDLDVVLRITKRLPSLPQATLHALRIIHDPNCSISDLARIIGLDQALAVRVLRWANSPFYGLRCKVSSLPHAIMVMGTVGIRDLLLAVSVSEMLNRKIPGYGLERGQLWRHSMAVAAGSQWLASAQKHVARDQAFIAGLLHDIGKLVLDKVLCQETTWQTEWSERQAQGASFMDLERWLTGLDHAELGGRIAEEWGLPPILAEAIACHHEPGLATIEPRVTQWVHLADAAALMLGIGLGYDGLSYELIEEDLLTPRFRSSDLEALMEAEKAAISEAESMFQHTTSL